MALEHLTDEQLLEYKKLYEKGLNKTKRFEQQKIYNCDLKFLYHVVRLLNECEMILTEGTLDLQRNREQLKAIRRGEWTIEQIKKYFDDKERQLEEVYNKSELPHSPDEGKIKKLLIQCLEHHFGNLDTAIHVPDKYETALREISEVCKRIGV